MSEGHREVLVLLEEPPFPAMNGPQHQALGLLRSLQSTGCDVVGFYRDEEEHLAWARLETELTGVRCVAVFPRASGPATTARRVIDLVQSRPVSFERYRSHALSAWLREHATAQAYSVIHFNSFNLGQYLEDVHDDIATVLVPHDAYSLNALRTSTTPASATAFLRSVWQWRTFARHESTFYRRFSVVAPVSRVDASWLQMLDGKMHVEVLPIALAPELIHSGPADARSPGVLIGGDLVLPSIALEVADTTRLLAEPCSQAGVTLTVLGQWADRRSEQQVRALAAVRLVPWVEDYLEFVRGFPIYVYPQRSCAGIATKLQQAMALGLAVVARSETGVPLGITDGLDGRICDNDLSLGTAVAELVANPDLARDMGRAAATHAVEHFGQSAVALALARVYGRARIENARSHSLDPLKAV